MYVLYYMSQNQLNEIRNVVSGLKKAFDTACFPFTISRKTKKQTKTFENFKDISCPESNTKGQGREVLGVEPDGGSGIANRQMSNSQKHDRMPKGSFIHKHYLSNQYVPGITLGTKDSIVNKIRQNPCTQETYCLMIQTELIRQSRIWMYVYKLRQVI